MPFRVIVALAFTISLCMSLPAPLRAADLEKGMAATSAGDYEAALEEFRPLAEEGDPVAQNALGVFYTHGLGVPVDPRQGVEWFLLSADGGYASAQYNLGLAYERGRGVEQDLDAAGRWYRLAADQGRTAAMLALGALEIHFDAWDPDAAAEWYRKAAEAGDVEGLFRLGIMHLDYGYPRDDRAALGWLLQAADQGHEEAQSRIDRLYTEAEIAASRGNFPKAFEIWEPLAGHGDADAQFNLGLMYEDGDGVVRDVEKAIFLFTSSAEQGFAPAQLRLGTMYMMGRAVDRNDEKAVDLFQRAARQGEAGAAINLGTMYALGRGTERNLVFANAWYLIAAKLDQDLKPAAEIGVQADQGEMSQVQLAEAERLAELCIETELADCPGWAGAALAGEPQAGASAQQPPERPEDVEALLREGQFQAALDLAARLRQKAPGNAELKRLEARAHYRLALEARADGRSDEALAHYGSAIEISDGAHAHALNGRALTYAARGDLDLAFRDINAALSVAPDNSLFLANRCTFHRLAGRLERALEDCDRALSVDLPSNRPNRSWVFLQRGLVLRMSGALEASIPDFRETIAYAKADTVRRVQEMMTAAGLYAGRIDGRVNAQLDAAVEACIRDDTCFEAASRQISDIVEFME